MQAKSDDNPGRTSFRDPDGQVHLIGDRVLRTVKPEIAPQFEEFLASETVGKWVSAGKFVESKLLAESPAGFDGQIVYEHPRVAFPSFAHEWPPEMLYRAADLTLTLAEEGLAAGWGLKDATPSNVLFNGTEPVFIDVLSFEKRDPADPIWIPAGQFGRTFLIPLLAWKLLGLAPNELLASHRDGVQPEEAARWFRGTARFDRDVIGQVRLPARLAKSKSQPSSERLAAAKKLAPEAAQFVLRSTMKGLRHALERLAPGKGSSMWRSYMQTHSYDAESFKIKEQFVREAVREARPATALDVGCNTGHFSRLAAESGAKVLGIDYDLPALDEAYLTARKDKKDVLSLAVDLTRPTPAVGWANRENPSFLERAEGAFDLVLYLAVIHHMTVTERVPMGEVLRVARQMTRGYAIIEFVSPADPMFKSISVGRDHLFAHFSEAYFEEEASRYFTIVRSQPVNNGLRRLYFLKTK
ncbi:MAG TPA: methyltransferase [Fimbriimonadaceae bacterium]|nr:methyltransferase [Fimbriimonadaceae bacterium]